MADLSKFSLLGVIYSLKDSFARSELLKKIQKPDNPSDGQVLVYNGLSGEWEAGYSGSYMGMPVVLDQVTGKHYTFTCKSGGLGIAEVPDVINVQKILVADAENGSTYSIIVRNGILGLEQLT